MDSLRQQLPAAVMTVSGRSLDRAKVDQDSLKGDPKAVRAAVSSLPNTPDLYPTREDYIRMGAAIKAACADDPELGIELWLQWAGRWPDFEEDVAVADGDRRKPPFGLGAPGLFDQAAGLGGDAGRAAAVDQWFEDEPTKPPAEWS